MAYILHTINCGIIEGIKFSQELVLGYWCKIIVSMLSQFIEAVQLMINFNSKRRFIYQQLIQFLK